MCSQARYKRQKITGGLCRNGSWMEWGRKVSPQSPPLEKKRSAKEARDMHELQVGMWALWALLAWASGGGLWA